MAKIKLGRLLKEVSHKLIIEDAHYGDLFRKDITDFKYILKKQYDGISHSEDIKDVTSNIVYEEMATILDDYILNSHFDSWTEKDMDVFIKELIKRAKKLTNLTKDVWQEWSENQVDYFAEIKDLEQRKEQLWVDMEADPETKPEGGRIADEYATAIKALEDEIEALKKKYSYKENKKRIETLLKRYSKEILNLIKKEL